MKSLVIEDDYITSMVLQEMLLAYGTADIAENGLLGVNAVEKSIQTNEFYDVIFSDIMMPEMDGMEALEKIREIESNHNIEGKDRTKIIMCTALDDYETVKKSFSNQCDGYLVKPFTTEKVSEALKNLNLI
jgi:two-component system chemotaxis response regulator CheY